MNTATNSSEGLPPHSDAAERGILTCLLDGASLTELKRGGLTGTWFFDLRHRKTFAAIQAVSRDGATPDLVSVGTVIAGDPEFTDGVQFLKVLAAEAMGSANAGYWLGKLKDAAQRRAVIAAAARLNELATDEASNPAAVFSDAEAVLQSFRRSTDETALPEIVTATELLTDSEIRLPPELIAGVLHQGSKLILGGSSKSYKTWTLLDLAVSVATGAPWLGFATTLGKVLYVNLEIQAAFFRRRIADVAQAKHVELNGNLDVWNLRGFAADYRLLLPKIRNRIKDSGHSLLVIDPTYKLLGTADENSATDISALLNAVEDLAVTTGAAVAMAGHFAKGNASQKEAIDRISGSGVFARDPDSLLIFTKHETEGAFTVEMVLRNLPPVAPFVVTWQWPLFQRDQMLDPAKLKKPGRPPKHSPECLLECLGNQRLTTSVWKLKADEKYGIGKSVFYDLLKQLTNSEQVTQSATDEKWERINQSVRKSGNSEK